MTKVSIEVNPKLLELFQLAPFFSILCKVTGTNSSYDDKMVYGTIDMSSSEKAIYYITLDHIWASYPDQNKKGKITFFADSVGETIQYLTEKNASPIIGQQFGIKIADEKTPNGKVADGKTPDGKTPKGKVADGKVADGKTPDEKTPDGKTQKFGVGNHPSTSGNVTNQFCSNSRMKLSDIFLPVGISLLLIGGLHYVLPKKLLN
jgi:hypothetical protein